MCFFFFFKQKTAYEMRISDWSSDVCSSDLALEAAFDDMVIVAAVEIFDVQRDPGGLGEAVEEMLHHLRVPFADALHGEIRLEHQPGTPGNVQRQAGQRLVHRGIDADVAGYAALVAQRQIGRGSCRERVCQFVSIEVVGVYLKKKK